MCFKAKQIEGYDRCRAFRFNCAYISNGGWRAAERRPCCLSLRILFPFRDFISTLDSIFWVHLRHISKQFAHVSESYLLSISAGSFFSSFFFVLLANEIVRIRSERKEKCRDKNKCFLNTNYIVKCYTHFIDWWLLVGPWGDSRSFARIAHIYL